MCKPGEESAFLEKIDALMTPGITGISFSGRGFDNRVLAIQAMRHCPGFGLNGLARQALAGRFEGAHCDLADHFGGLGRPPGRARGDLPRARHSHQDQHQRCGRRRAVASGRISENPEYVAEDVCATYLCCLHFIAFARSDEALLTLPLAQLAGWIETEPGLAHLKAFADCRPARVARARAPVLKVEAALNDAERRVVRDHHDAAFAAGKTSPF